MDPTCHTSFHGMSKTENGNLFVRWAKRLRLSLIYIRAAGSLPASLDLATRTHDRVSIGPAEGRTLTRLSPPDLKWKAFHPSERDGMTAAAHVTGCPLFTCKLPECSKPLINSARALTEQGLLCVLLGERRVVGRQFLSSQDQVTFYPQLTAALCLLESWRASWYLW